MKLVTFHTVGDSRLGCLIGDSVIDLNLACEAMLREQGRVKALAREIADWVMAKALEPGEIRGLDIVRKAADVRLMAPIANPEKIICAAQNFWDALKARGKEPPPEPKVFSKFANSVCAWDDDVVHPNITQALGYEAEMAFVIGKTCKKVPEKDAFSVIAGYMTYNDITASDLTKRDGQNTRGKGFDTFSVMGPWLVTGDEVPDPHDLGVRLTVNGRLLQNGSTKDLVYDIARLVAFCSEVFTLKPGDVIATGSPNGLASDYDPPAFLKPGDMMETEISGLGICRNRIAQED